MLLLGISLKTRYVICDGQHSECQPLVRTGPVHTQRQLPTYMILPLDQAIELKLCSRCCENITLPNDVKPCSLIPLINLFLVLHFADCSYFFEFGIYLRVKLQHCDQREMNRCNLRRTTNCRVYHTKSLRLQVDKLMCMVYIWPLVFYGHFGFMRCTCVFLRILYTVMFLFNQTFHSGSVSQKILVGIWFLLL